MCKWGQQGMSDPQRPDFQTKERQAQEQSELSTTNFEHIDLLS